MIKYINYKTRLINKNPQNNVKFFWCSFDIKTKLRRNVILEFREKFKLKLKIQIRKLSKVKKRWILEKIKLRGIENKLDEFKKNNMNKIIIKLNRGIKKIYDFVFSFISTLFNFKKLIIISVFLFTFFFGASSVFAVSPSVDLNYSENPANAGSMTVTATYSEAILGNPTIGINQPGTTDITNAAMTIPPAANWTELTSAGARNWRSIASSSDGIKLAAVEYGGYIYTSIDSGATWTKRTTSGLRNWQSIASSTDGTKLAAAVYGGYIYTSIDSGATWTERTTSGLLNWYSIASSSDGTKLAAVAYGGYIYTSTDSGVTWTQRTTSGSRSWWSITSSSDGTKLAAAVDGGYIYTSIDSGANWTQRTVWGAGSIASSSDGTKLAAGTQGGGYIYTSINSGATWTARTSSGSRNWWSITSSSDGTKLAAVTSYAGYIYTSTDSGITWTEQTSSGSRSWKSIASSSDGTKLAAVVGNGYIYTSTDSGATWTERTSSGSNTWRSIASSTDGTKLAAAVYGGYIYTSTNSGVSWTARTNAGLRNWQSIASSSDGTKLVAGVYPGYIYTSTDSGATWTERTGPGSAYWGSIASSSDGTKLAASIGSYGAGYIYTSTDSGVSWTARSSSGQRQWKSISSSSDGTKLAAAVYGSYIFTSTDSGASWTQRTSSGSRTWSSIASSSDGTKLAAVVNASANNYIFTSIDSGATWTQQTSAGQRQWQSIASSSNGTKLAVGVNGGYIYTSTDSGVTWTERTTSGSRTWYSIASSDDGTKLAAVVDNGYIYTTVNQFNTYTYDYTVNTANGSIYIDGPATISLSTVTDLSGNPSLAPTNNTFTIDTTGPNAALTYSENPANAGAVTVTATYSEAILSDPTISINQPGTTDITNVAMTLPMPTWTERTTSGSRTWYSIASSDDGTKLAAVPQSGYIYTSIDSGATWIERITSGSRGWRSIASSSDGTKLAAVVDSGYIYTSTDSGATWTERTSASTYRWWSIASSDDGTKLAIVGLHNYIYTSADSGATWTQRTTPAGATQWVSIASSSDGTKLAAVIGDYNVGYIYTSTDSGATWTAQTASGSRRWKSITSSSDGTKLAAVVDSGYIYTSTDSGATWTERTSSGSLSWYSIASSSDGTKLVAGSLSYIYISTNAGATWTAQTSAGSRTWYSIASSSDGTKLVAGVFSGYIYTAVNNSFYTYTYNYTVNTANGSTYVDGPATVSLSTVTDLSGNSSLTPTNNTFTIDTTAPTSTITSICSTAGNGCTAGGISASPQQAYDLQSIAGTASDSSGSGVSSVKISIKNTNTNTWYNGTSFVDVTETYLTATGTDTWSYDTSLMTPTIGHTYTINVKAIDNATNEQTPVSNLSFVFANSPPVISNVTASQNSSGVVNVTYDVTDVESSQTTNYLFYTVGAILSGAITSGETSLTVSDATYLPTSGTINIEDEMISYTSKTGNTLNGLTRGALNTTALSHNISSVVYLNATSATGTGLSNIGTGKAISWLVGTDNEGYENISEVIKVLANDGSTGSMVGALTSSSFIIDAVRPTTTGTSLLINNSNADVISFSSNVTFKLQGITGYPTDENIFVQFSRDAGTTYYGANANGTLSGAGTMGTGFSSSTATVSALSWPWILQSRSETITVKITDSYGNYSTDTNTVGYNATPEFNVDYPTTAAGGLSVSQILDSGDANWGKVKIQYSIRDTDTNEGIVPNFVTPTFSYDVGAGFVTIGAGDIAYDSAPVGGEIIDQNIDGSLDNRVSTSSYYIYTAYWTPSTPISTSTGQFKLTIDDLDVINNTANVTVSSLTLDSTDPSGAIVTFDAGIAGVTGSATITIPMPTDLSTVEYRITDGDSESDATTTGWTSITANTTIPWTFDSDIEAKTLKYEYRDLYNNATTQTTISTKVPIPASSFLVQDATNLSIPSYDMYVGWAATSSTDFSSYKLEYATSADNITFGSYSSVEDGGVTNYTTNYYLHRPLSSSLFYRYRLGVVNQAGNTSVRTGAYITAKPDGVQNYGEGGGGSVPIASQVENIVPTQNANKSVTVTYLLTDSSISLKTTPTYESYLFYNIGVTLPSNALSGDNLTVSDASKLKSSGYIQINNEVIKYTSKAGNVLSGLTRGTWPTDVTSTRTTRTNSVLFAGTPVWILASGATPIAITNTTISAGQTGSIAWDTYNESSLAGSSYNNVGVRVLVHDNQVAGSGPLSTQNDYSEIGILNTLDLTVPTITLDSTSSTGAESVTSVNFGITLARAYPVNSTVSYAVTGTATGTGIDYTLADGTATITAGDTTTNITATIVNDIIYESSETIIVTISSPTNATLGANTVHTYTITDDDTLSTIAFDTTSSNGLESVTSVNIPVTISVASGSDTTVDYTVTGTATGSGTDYTLANGTATITAGQTTTNITATIVNDSINELNETIQVTLSNPSGATLGTNTVHTYTITDDDTASTIAFTEATSNGLESVTAVTIPVSLSLASYQDITVAYAVTGGTATGSGTDYTLASGVATITAGNTTTNISVTVVNDTIQEAGETIILTLSAPSNATLGTNTVHTYTITDDESTPTIAFTTTSGTGAESVTPVAIGITLSAVSGLETTVNYTLTGTATGSGTDYTLANGTATVIAGQTTTSISLVVTDDVLSEVSETVILTLSSPTNSTLGVNAVYTYTITDNDTDPTVGFTTATSNGLESVTPVNIAISISAVSSKDTTVDYAVTGGTATSGVDYILASGTATITAGQTTTNITATIIDESTYESNETIIITISNPTNLSLGANTTHTYTITNNDADTIDPVVTLIGEATVSVTKGDSYTELGSTVTDNLDTGLSAVITGSVNTSVVGSYLLTYTATDSAGNTGTATRTVNVVLADTYDIVATTGTGGTISPLGTTIVPATTNQTYTITPEAGYSIATLVVDEQSLNPASSYTFTNVVTTHTIAVTFTLTPDTTPPVITLTQVSGADAVTVIKDSGTYTDAGATIIDAVDGVCTAGDTSTNPTSGTCVYSTSGTVNTTAVSTYTFTYTAKDSSGNTSSLSRSVTVAYASTYTITSTAGTGGTIDPLGETAVPSTTDQVYTITPSEGYSVATLVVDGVSLATTSSHTFSSVVTSHTIAVTFSPIDGVPPTFTILGDNPMTINTGDVFIDPGATAVDASTNEAVTVTSVGTVNTSVAGTYTITYFASDSSGNNGTAEREVIVVDITAPVISNIETPVISSSAAVIVWQTNEPSNSQVSWGSTTGSLTRNTEVSSVMTAYHVMSLSSNTNDIDSGVNTLLPETTYYYIVKSSDAYGNETISEENTFATTSEGQVIVVSGGGGSYIQNTNTSNFEENLNTSTLVPDVTAPTISNVNISDINAFGATISFDTDELTVSSIDYGININYEGNMGSNNSNKWSTSHSIKLSGLRLGTNYHYLVNAIDKSGNSTITEDKTFKTKFLTEVSSDLKKVENLEQFQEEIENTIESILPSLLPPFIEKPNIVNVTENSATITFRTNIKAYPAVNFSTDEDYIKLKDNPYTGEITDTTEKNYSHNLVLEGLKANTKYHVMTKAFSIPQVVGKSDDLVFTTLPSKINGSIIDLKKDSFSVVWITDEPTSSIVDYKNMSTGRVSRIIDNSKNKSHSIKIENLTPGTSYKVDISGVNNQGNIFEGANSLFTRTSVDVTAPLISNVKVDSALVVGRTDRIQTIISWQTDEASTSVVYFEEGSGTSKNKLKDKQEDLSILVTNHSMVLTSLKPGTVYRFQIASTDMANNTTETPIRTIITPKRNESIVDVIFKNFDETFNFMKNF